MEERRVGEKLDAVAESLVMCRCALGLQITLLDDSSSDAEGGLREGFSSVYSPLAILVIFKPSSVCLTSSRSSSAKTDPRPNPASTS